MDAAMVRVRVRDFKLIYPLEKYVDQVLPLLEKYTDDPSPLIHSEILDLARRRHSAEALKILSLMVAHRKNDAVDSIYQNYSPSEIKLWGGPLLKRNLLIYLRKEEIDNGPSSIYALILLTAFPPDPATRLFVANIRVNGLSYTENVYSQGQTIKRQVKRQLRLPYRDAPKDLALGVDLVLSEEGDTDASQRVIQSLRQGEVTGTVDFLVRSARFIQQKPVLREIVERIRDKRLTRFHYRIVVWTEPIVLSPDKAAPVIPEDDTLRVCDLAVAGLVENSGIDVGIPDLTAAIKKNPQALPRRRYTDDELDKAYAALKSGL